MKIAYVAPYTTIPSKTANSVHVMKMCDSYVSLDNVEVFLFVSRNKTLSKNQDVFKQYELIHEFPIIEILISRYNFFRILQFFLFFPIFLKLKQVDYVHTRNLSVALGCVLFRIPTILELHDSPVSNKRGFNIFKKCMKSKFLVRLIVITEALKKHLIDIFPSSSNKLLHLPDGVSEKSLKVKNVTKNDRDSLGIKFDFCCVYTGHLYKGRGIDLIINLAELAPDIGFYIVGGNDESVAFYRRKCAEIFNIHFVGFVNLELVRKYQLAGDILLMPYENEVFVSGSAGNSTSPFASPLKMFEYMATGRVIISSQLPVLYEVLREGENAIMIEYDDVNGWLTAIRRLQKNPEIGVFIGEAAKKDVACFTWENRVRTIIKYLKISSS
ncbi:glycosyltransferase [uncultured Algoriphagus sp.]|uniref:glycosyltransferase n=1 Tax=uncultured Algoriphagus sp. TaxID=417365 RepID=UPI0030EF3B21|tara:strand:- start:12980 stop:14131 length:1152 start_codon:yes stop_codon:yes gene_type:complete